MHIERFRVEVSDAALTDLHERLARTRWPDQLPGSRWDYGTDTAYLRELCDYWLASFDWRAAEAGLNAWPQFVTTTGGQRLHFLHVRSAHPMARPLLLLHGWPSTSAEFLRIIGPLVDPTSHGGRVGHAFHVIAPSLPGFGWSGPTTDFGWSTRRIATALIELIEHLGYPRVGVHGTDFGSVVGTHLATAAPERLTGLHLTLLPSSLRPRDREPTPEERLVIAAQDAVRAEQSGYAAVQSTTPQTLAHALVDSPAGQAAWIVEKFRSWTDCNGDLESTISRDELLANITTYWMTGTAGSSARLYFEDRRDAAPRRYVTVPTAYAAFPGDVYPASRTIAEDHYDVRRWTPMPRGGHFAALETPQLLVDDLRGFFADEPDEEGLP